MVTPSVTEILRHGATRPHAETVRPLHDAGGSSVRRLPRTTSA